MLPLADLLICLRFFSRLPVSTTRREIDLGERGLSHGAAMVPVAGLLIGAAPAAVLSFAVKIGLPSTVSALLAVASLVVITGALHEDALADCADGFGGGQTRDDKLRIMRDSRIGAFGTVAVVLVLGLRAAALAAALTRGGGVVAVLLAAVLSRVVCLAPLMLLPPAHRDGLGAAAARPSLLAGGLAAALTLGFAVVAAAMTDALRVGSAVTIAAMAAVATSLVAWRQIGGQTGDVAGAAQQVAEAGVLIVFAAAP